MNIIHSWQSHNKRNKNTQTAGLAIANTECSLKIALAGIADMRNGKRKVPECFYNFMLNCVIDYEIEAANKERDNIWLVNALSLPERVK